LRLERAELGITAALAAAIPVSIFAAEILLALALVVLAVRLLTHRTRLGSTPLDTPLVALAVWTLLAASFASDPPRSHEDAKKLVLYALFYLGIEVLSRGARRERILPAVLLGGLALATLMVLQHHLLGFDDLNRRPHGFLGHYMSAAGVTMCVLLLAVARLVFGERPSLRLRDAWLAGLVLAGVGVVAAADGSSHGQLATRLFVAGLVALAATVALAPPEAVRGAETALPIAVVPIASWALVVSQTRSAWIGVLLGLGFIFFLRTPKLLLVLGAVVAAVILLRPSEITERLTVEDASSVDRYYMWQAGIDMVLDRPVFGQGPGMVEVVYPRYRWPEAKNPRQPHLHNNPLEIAAERGLPGLAFFLWWTVILFTVALREARRAAAERPSPGWSAIGALAALAAVFVAGLFEYNLGDSEVLMLALLLTAVPFALGRERATAA
jgi:O-antigen ligase